MDQHKKTCFGCGKTLLVSKTKTEIFMQGNYVLCHLCNKKWEDFRLITKQIRQRQDLEFQQETKAARLKVFGKPKYEYGETFGDMTLDDEVKRMEEALSKKKAELGHSIKQDQVAHGANTAVNELKQKLTPTSQDISDKDEILNLNNIPENTDVVIPGDVETDGGSVVTSGNTGEGQEDME